MWILYQQVGSNNLTGWKLKVGVANSFSMARVNCCLDMLLSMAHLNIFKDLNGTSNFRWSPGNVHKYSSLPVWEFFSSSLCFRQAWRKSPALSNCLSSINIKRTVVYWPSDNINNTTLFWNENEKNWASNKTYNKNSATSKDLDQPAHPCSLIRVFADRMIYSLQAIQRGMNEIPGYTGWMYRLIWVFAGHTSYCRFCCALAQIIASVSPDKMIIE